MGFSFTHQIEIVKRLKALVKKRDPLSVKPLCANTLRNMFLNKCKDYFSETKPITKYRAYIPQVQMALILKEEGFKEEDGKLLKISNVSTLPRDDFVGITRALADGDPLFSAFNSGKRLKNLK